MSKTSLPTSYLLDKSVVREALRGLVRETLGMPLPPRQGASLGVIRQLKAPYQQATLPEVVSTEELRAQIAL